MSRSPHAVLAPVPLSRDARRARTAVLFAELDGPAPVDQSRAVGLREELVLINAEVARALARRFRGRGVDLDDLEQVAYVALVRAVRAYDHARGADFLVFAVPTINGELKRHFRDHGWVIRVPRRIQETQRRLERNDAAPGVGEPYCNARLAKVADLVGASVADVDAALTARGCFSPASLDVSIGMGGTGRLGDLIPAVESDVDAAEARVTLAPLWAGLSQRDRLVLYLRYVEDRNQREIGEHLGVSQVQISRLLARILRDLRQRLVELPEAS